MLVDIYRGVAIVLKFVFHDFWVGAINLLFRRQNEKIKNTYNKRITANKKRL